MNDNHATNRNPVSADARAARRRARAAEASAEGEGASRPLPDDALIIVPVRNVVLFPGMVFPLTVGRERSRAAVQEAVRLQRPLGVLLQSKPDVDEPGPGRPALGRHDAPTCCATSRRRTARIT